MLLVQLTYTELKPGFISYQVFFSDGSFVSLYHVLCFSSYGLKICWSSWILLR